MAASTAAVGSVVLTTAPSALASGNAFRTTSVQIAPARSAVSSAPRVVATRAALSEEQSISRRDVLANLIGAGAALGFAGQALAANPGSLARQKKVEKPEKKVKPEAQRSASEIEPSTTISPQLSEGIEVATPSEAPTVQEATSLPKVSSLPVAPSSPQTPSAPDVPEDPSLPVVPTPPEEPSFSDYFKDLF